MKITLFMRPLMMLTPIQRVSSPPVLTTPTLSQHILKIGELMASSMPLVQGELQPAFAVHQEKQISEEPGFAAWKVPWERGGVNKSAWLQKKTQGGARLVL